MPDELAEFHVEHPNCGHMVTIRARPQQSIADYNSRLVPELREAIQKPCDQCEQERLKQIKQKLEQDAKVNK